MSPLEQVLEKIKNQETLTREEAIIAYGKETIEAQEKEYIELTPQEQETLTQELFKEEIETSKKIKELSQNKDNQILARLEKLESRITPKNTQEIENIDQHFLNYLEHRKNFDKVSNSSLKAYKASYRYLKYFINENTTFNFSFFKQLQKDLQQLPKNFFKNKKYYQSTIEQVLKLRKKENYEPLDPKTINNHLSNFKTFFDYLIYEEIIKENPLLNIKPLQTSEEIKREEYTQKELDIIFNSNMEQEYKYLCKISLYTGLRLEEVLLLKKQDIKDNFIHINLQDTSNKKHQRIIPIHKNILNPLNELKKNKEGIYLFFNKDLENRARNIGKRINRKLKELVKDKSFHSFRKNFSQEIELNTTAEEKTKKYLMGHSFTKDVTHMVYNRGKTNLEKLEDCINQITYIY
jgi:integrase